MAAAGAVFYAFGLFVDAQLMDSRAALLVMAVTRGLVVLTLGALLLVLLPRRPRPFLSDVLISLSQIIVAAATCLIIALSPGDIVFHALTVMVILLVFYLFVPNRLVITTAIALTLSITFVAVAIARMNPPVAELTLVVLYLLLVNCLGAFSAQLVRRERRERFLMLESERRARRDLDLEMAAREEAEAALAASEVRHRQLFESSPFAILVHRDGKVIYSNSEACRIIGAQSPDDLEGADIFELIAEDSRELARRRIELMVTSASSVPPAEFKIHAFDGRILYLELASSVAEFADGPAIQTVGTDVTESKRLREELERLATIDILTGARNRHSFFSEGEAEIRRARRHQRELALVLFDIDYFKKVNDTYGHAVGDSVLSTLGEECRRTLRAEDVFGRIGGEEFAVLLPEGSGRSARATAERLRDRIANLRFPPPAEAVHITVSAGVVDLLPEDDGLDDVLRRADDAMYAAKRAGRNRVEQG